MEQDGVNWKSGDRVEDRVKTVRKIAYYQYVGVPNCAESLEILKELYADIN